MSRLPLDLYLTCWILQKCAPIYKRGDKSVITNYRPISILPSFSKIYEKLWFTMVTVTIIISFRLLHIQSIVTIKLFSIHLIHINIYKYIYVGISIYNSYFLNTFGWIRILDFYYWPNTSNQDLLVTQ